MNFIAGVAKLIIIVFYLCVLGSRRRQLRDPHLRRLLRRLPQLRRVKEDYV